MTVFGIHCNSFIVYLFDWKLVDLMGFFYQQKVRVQKIGRVSEVLCAWARPISIVRAVCPGLIVFSIVTKLFYYRLSAFLWNSKLCNCLCSSFSSSCHSSSLNGNTGNSKQKIILQTIKQLKQFTYLVL